GHVARECAARYRVSQFLSGSAAELAAASAALVEHFLGGSPAAFLEGTTPQLHLTNLETSPAGCDPRRRERALGEAEPLLGAEEEPTLGLLRAYNLLALGENAAALAALGPYTRAYPDDPAGWEAFVTAARQMSDPELLAGATQSLAECSQEPASAARLFEEAAALYLDRLGDVTRGEAALRRAVGIDVSRSSSFERLSKLLRERGDAAGLLELCERRLQIPVPSAERLELEWQRARAHRQLGDAPAALAALDRVVALDTRHIRALALFGEIYITQQRHREATEVLARLAETAEASAEERLTSGLFAVDLYENQLQNTERALEVLLALERAGLGGLAVRERLARAAAKSESWDDAVVVLEQLMFERSTPEERAEAARLALAIHRDRRDDPTSTLRAARALLELEPCDAEALDVLLGASPDAGESDAALQAARDALAEHLQRDPFQLDALKRLARVADRTGSASVRQVAVGALLALGYGGPSSGARAELAALDQQLCTRPSLVFGADLLGELRDPNDSGPVCDLLALVASHLGRALGPELSLYKVSRRERILPGSGAPVREEVQAWAHAFGLGELELYASGVAHGHVVALATEPTSVVLGFGVVAPLGPFQRQELARALYAQSRGLGVLTELEESDVPGLVAGLCQLGGVALDAPHYARQADYERHLGRVLPRKIRKALPAAAEAVRAGGVDIAAWASAARRSLDRAAALAVGDLSVVLSLAPPSDREAPMPAAPTERTRRLASFMLAPAFDTLRRRCGVIRT
ncbi:MAG TPA: hypothetical protein VG963_05345, partial [Polyangiaceae bacterium]|nr:hypothetical protein [Polyangiaceae bacterium]